MRSGAGWLSVPSPETVTATGVPAGGALQAATHQLAAAGCQTPRLDAELLLAEVLRVDRAGLVLAADRQLSPAEQLRFRALLDRRGAREPVAYILGRRWFRGLELRVDRRVLIPRPETELLVEAALELPRGWRVTDVGTGSGAVALALAAERPDLHLSGGDLSADAVAVARANAARLRLPVPFWCADLLPEGEYDAVLANLPYVAEPDRERLAPEITDYEPPAALFAPAGGLALIQRLVGELRPSVRFVALEVGQGQAPAVEQLLAAAGYGEVRVLPDLAGIDRALVGRR